jgi:hypothetical protein
MDGDPDKPRRETTKTHPTAFQNCEALADHCQVSFIEVAEWTRHRSSRDELANEITGEASLLHCHLRNPRQRLPILIE